MKDTSDKAIKKDPISENLNINIDEYTNKIGKHFWVVCFERKYKLQLQHSTYSDLGALKREH